MPKPHAVAPPADAASTAEQLAESFYASATAIRDSTRGMSLADADRLDAQADALEEQGDGFTAEAIAAILGTLQTDLGRIQKVTSDANVQITKLRTADKIITVATMVLAVGTAAASGDPAAIIKTVQALADSLTGTAAVKSADSTNS